MKRFMLAAVVLLSLMSVVPAFASPRIPAHIDCQFTTWANRLYGPTFVNRGMTLQPVVQALVDTTTGDYCGQLRSTAGFQRSASNCNDWLFSALFDGTQFEGEVGPIRWTGCGSTGWNYVWSTPITTRGCMDAWGSAWTDGGGVTEVAGRSSAYCP